MVAESLFHPAKNLCLGRHITKVNSTTRDLSIYKLVHNTPRINATVYTNFTLFVIDKETSNAFLIPPWDMDFQNVHISPLEDDKYRVFIKPNIDLQSYLEHSRPLTRNRDYFVDGHTLVLDSTYSPLPFTFRTFDNKRLAYSVSMKVSSRYIYQRKILPSSLLKDSKCINTNLNPALKTEPTRWFGFLETCRSII